MNYPLPPPSQVYHPVPAAMGPPPPPDALSAQAFINGGSLPGPGKTLEQAHQENLIKYRKLKAKYFELENRWKEAMNQLDRARQQNIRLKDEKSGFLDRVVELESIIAHTAATNGAPPMPSSAFSRNFVYSRQQISGSVPPDYSNLSKALDEDDEDDARKNSKHVGAALKRREEEEEQRRLEEERQRRAVKRPRVTKSFVPPPAAQPGAGPPYAHYDPSGTPEDMYNPQAMPPAAAVAGAGPVYSNHQAYLVDDAAAFGP